MPPAVEAWILNHWTTREVLSFSIFHTCVWNKNYGWVSNFLLVIPVNAETQKDEGIHQGQRQDLGCSAVSDLLPARLCSWAVVEWHMIRSTSEPLAPGSSPCRAPWSFPLGVSCTHNSRLFTYSSSSRVSSQAPF